MKMNITINKLARPEHVGDWHDKPLRWVVNGPATECQKFSTRKESELYARLRRQSPDFQTASRAFIAAP